MVLQALLYDMETKISRKKLSGMLEKFNRKPQRKINILTRSLLEGIEWNYLVNKKYWYSAHNNSRMIVTANKIETLKKKF